MTTPPGEPQLMIVGPGRSGSGYISRVLTAAGVPCGHEQWWNPLGVKLPGLAADSSWIGLAHVQNYHGAVVLQTRHPLDVLTSFVRAPLWGPYLATAEQMAGPHCGDEIEFAVRVTVRLLQRAVKWCGTSPRWQVEQVGTGQIMALADLAGRPCWLQAAEQAIASIPRDFNQHQNGDRITIEDLGMQTPFDRGLLEELEAMIESLGYRP